MKILTTFIYNWYILQEMEVVSVENVTEPKDLLELDVEEIDSPELNLCGFTHLPPFPS